MANNRMVLICNTCVPLGSDWPAFGSTALLHIAKWYPAEFISDIRQARGETAQPGDGAYYTNSDELEKWGKRFFDFLKEHEHTELRSGYYSAGAGQPNPVRLEYESVDLPVLESKK